MNAANGGTDLQERIAAARREADGLKDQIRQRKEKLADTTCEYDIHSQDLKEPCPPVY